MRKLPDIIRFLLAAVVVGLAVRLLGALPGVLDPGVLRQHTSVDEARRAAGLATVVLPAYFPDRFGWPPAEILAAARPAPQIGLSFRNRRNGNTGLSIVQSQGTPATIRSRIEPVRIISIQRLRLAGRSVTLETALCADAAPCNRLAWSEGALRIVFTLRGPEAELLRLAESAMTNHPRQEKKAPPAARQAR